MSVTWPENLLPPKLTNLKPTNITLRRKTQSGRYEIRRFGTSAPDQFEATWDFSASEFEDFKKFYEISCEMGAIWFTANWLENIGYTTSHVARFFQLMEFSGNSGTKIVKVILLVQHVDNI